MYFLRKLCNTVVIISYPVFCHKANIAGMENWS